MVREDAFPSSRPLAFRRGAILLVNLRRPSLKPRPRTFALSSWLMLL
jgi:hypothetical protein